MEENFCHKALRKPSDHVRDSLIVVLYGAGEIEFNSIVERVQDIMKKRNLSTGGEEMLKLRIYEKLQNIVSQGGISKKGKVYTETPEKMQMLYRALTETV